MYRLCTSSGSPGRTRAASTGSSPRARAAPPLPPGRRTADPPLECPRPLELNPINTFGPEELMLRTLLALVVGALIGMGGLALTHDDKDEVRRKVVGERDIAEKLDGKEARA